MASITLTNLEQTNAVTIAVNQIPILRHVLGLAVPTQYHIDPQFLQAAATQLGCGACWAVTVASVLRDRLDYFYHATPHPRASPALIPELSIQYLLNCARNRITYHGRTGVNASCAGGFNIAGLAFCKTCGIPTAAVFPFSSWVCEAEGVCSRQQRACPGIPAVVYKCDSYYMVSIYETFGQLNAENNTVQMSATQLSANAYNIQVELWQRGTVACAMNLYSDFIPYWTQASPDDVYQLGWQQGVAPVALQGPLAAYLGDIRWTADKPGPYGLYFSELHAFAMVGWGVSATGVPYWLCRNSWGPHEGPLQNGLFKVLRGQNVCGIESCVCACWFERARPNVTVPGLGTWDLSVGIVVPELPLTHRWEPTLPQALGYALVTLVCVGLLGLLVWRQHVKNQQRAAAQAIE